MIPFVWLSCILAVVSTAGADRTMLSSSSLSSSSAFLGWSSSSDQTAKASPSGAATAMASTTMCGGTLTATRGVIQTPNFPEKFPVPIQCTWIIDTSSSNTPEYSIIIYFTQQFVLSGLQFTPYAYYSDDYKVPEPHAQTIFELNEQTVSTISWVRFNSPFLEIKFTMNSLYGTHLRALDRLLDVYGFNITYEVDNNVKQDQCNALRCRYLGHCYATQNFS